MESPGLGTTSVDRLEKEAARLSARLSKLAEHGDNDANINAARQATLGQLKATAVEIENAKFLLARKQPGAEDDELPRCRWGAVKEQAHCLLKGADQHPFGQLNKTLSKRH